MERLAKLYICMAILKSSKLFRNWKKDLNSSNVIPCKERTTIKQCLCLWNIKLMKCVWNDKVPHERLHVSTLQLQIVLQFTQYLICFLSSCGESFSMCVGPWSHQIDNTPKQTKYTLLHFPCAVWTRWAVSSGGRIVAFERRSGRLQIFLKQINLILE